MTVVGNLERDMIVQVYLRGVILMRGFEEQMEIRNKTLLSEEKHRSTFQNENRLARTKAGTTVHVKGEFSSELFCLNVCLNETFSCLVSTFSGRASF